MDRNAVAVAPALPDRAAISRCARNTPEDGTLDTNDDAESESLRAPSSIPDSGIGGTLGIGTSLGPLKQLPIQILFKKKFRHAAACRDGWHGDGGSSKLPEIY